MARLRAVTPDDKPKPRRPRTLKEAVQRSERELLVTMRARIAAEIDGGVPPHTLAPLTRQLRDLDKEIRLLDERAADESGQVVSGDSDWDEAAI